MERVFETQESTSSEVELFAAVFPEFDLMREIAADLDVQNHVLQKHLAYSHAAETIERRPLDTERCSRLFLRRVP